LDQFTVVHSCAEGPLTWFIEYEGLNSSASDVNITTCTGACCNLTYCINTIDTNCSIIGNTTFQGFYTNCTSGINGTSPCGTPGPINPLVNCTINNGAGLCRTGFGYNNTNSVQIVIPVGTNNFFTPQPQDRGQTTVFQPGVNFNQFVVFWNCTDGSLSWTISVQQTFVQSTIFKDRQGDALSECNRNLMKPLFTKESMF